MYVCTNARDYLVVHQGYRYHVLVLLGMQRARGLSATACIHTYTYLLIAGVACTLFIGRQARAHARTHARTHTCTHREKTMGQHGIIGSTVFAPWVRAQTCMYVCWSVCRYVDGWMDGWTDHMCRCGVATRRRIGRSCDSEGAIRAFPAWAGDSAGGLQTRRNKRRGAKQMREMRKMSPDPE